VFVAGYQLRLRSGPGFSKWGPNQQWWRQELKFGGCKPLFWLSLPFLFSLCFPPIPSHALSRPSHSLCHLSPFPPPSLPSSPPLPLIHRNIVDYWTWERWVVSTNIMQFNEFEYHFACRRKVVHLCFIMSPCRMIFAVLELWLSPLQWVLNW